MGTPGESVAEHPELGSEEAEPRRRPWRIGLTTALLLAVAIGAFTLPTRIHAPVPMCAMYAITDVPCALCGMTRASVLLAHGHVAEAVRYHPVVVLLMPYLAVTLLVSLRRDLTGKRPGPYWRRVSRGVEWLILVTILGYGAGRAILILALGIEPW